MGDMRFTKGVLSFAVTRGYVCGNRIGLFSKALFLEVLVKGKNVATWEICDTKVNSQYCCRKNLDHVPIQISYQKFYEFLTSTYRR
jgi:hypothetical protein